MKLKDYYITTENYLKELEKDTRYNVYGNFLDRFRYCANKEERLEIINGSPGMEKNHLIDLAKLAATVEVLAKEYDLEIPSGVYDKRYYLTVPYFSGATIPEYKKWLTETAPEEFKKRNVFLGENVMNRTLSYYYS